jgi:tight adherence protein B
VTLFQTLALYAALFIGVLLLSEAIITLVKLALGGDKQLDRRLAGQEKTAAEKKEALASIRRQTIGEGGLESFIPFYASLTRLLYLADIKTSPDKIGLIMVLLSFCWIIFFWIATPFLPPYATFPLATILGFGPVIMYLIMAKNSRVEQFENQLPDALDLIVRSLRVGHPLSAAIGVVGKEMPHPIGTEFRVAFDEVTYGQDVSEALQQLSDRVPVPDLKYLTVSVQIQSESGGNLAEVLGGLATVIRDRFRMFRKVKALTTEGRMSSWFLSFFPIFIVVFIQMVKPDYYTQVMDYQYFNHLVLITVILLILNLVAMKIITTLKV